jgi:radical SAM-linked protein
MKLRVRYSKLGKVRFVSHRDSARLWERAMRKVALPVAYTRGFTPRPKLAFGLALPTGAESVAEYIDVDLADVELDPSDPQHAASLSSALPTGLDVQVVAERPDRSISLQESVVATTWVLSGPGITPSTIQEAVDRLLAADEVIVERERKGRRHVDDVRPLIVHLGSDASGTRLVAELANEGRALRPSELASAAFPGIDALGVHVLRTHQWMDCDGERREVLSLPAGAGVLDGGRHA